MSPAIFSHVYYCDREGTRIDDQVQAAYVRLGIMHRGLRLVTRLYVDAADVADWRLTERDQVINAWKARIAKYHDAMHEHFLEIGAQSVDYVLSESGDGHSVASDLLF